MEQNFKANENYNQNSKENCKNQLDAAVAKGYSDIKAEHTEDVSKLFNRMKVENRCKRRIKSLKIRPTSDMKQSGTELKLTEALCRFGISTQDTL